MFLPGGFTPSFRLPMASCWIWLARRGEHRRPSNLVSSGAFESLGAFANRTIDAIERVGSLALKTIDVRTVLLYMKSRMAAIDGARHSSANSTIEASTKPA